MPKGISNKRYKRERKQRVVEIMHKEKPNYKKQHDNLKYSMTNG